MSVSFGGIDVVCKALQGLCSDTIMVFSFFPVGYTLRIGYTATMANAPDRFALFILGPDEKRVEITEDTHIANAVTIVLNKEDHTLGNMLRQ